MGDFLMDANVVLILMHIGIVETHCVKSSRIKSKSTVAAPTTHKLLPIVWKRLNNNTSLLVAISRPVMCLAYLAARRWDRGTSDSSVPAGTRARSGGRRPADRDIGWSCWRRGRPDRCRSCSCQRCSSSSCALVGYRARPHSLGK